MAEKHNYPVTYLDVFCCFYDTGDFELSHFIKMNKRFKFFSTYYLDIAVDLDVAEDISLKNTF